MNGDAQLQDFLCGLRDFHPQTDRQTRILALYSATIALATKEGQDLAVTKGREAGVSRRAFYEAILQSYLFLGFPRMLAAAEHLEQMWPGKDEPRTPPEPYSGPATRRWFDRGTQLCQQVYGRNYETLRHHVSLIAPEIFLWMINEGYGKVLSRDGLDIVDRELSIVATLIVDDRPKQMLSHMLGAINVGGRPELLRVVIEDVGPSVGPGYQTALVNLKRVKGA